MKELQSLLKGASKGALAELAELCGVSKTTFVQGDSYQSAYNEGIRSIGLRLIHLANAEVAEVVTDVYKKRWKRKLTK